MKKENIFVFYLLSFTWGVLFTLIGLIALLFIRLFLKKMVYEYKIVAGRINVVFAADLPGAMNLGLVYITDVDSQDDMELHYHEIGHSIQNAWFGPFFIVIVAIPSLVRAMFWDKVVDKELRETGTYPDYNRIWFEGQATKLGETYIKQRLK